MKRVIIESPFKATERYSEQSNIQYARAAMADSLARGEAPFASHLLYTQRGILDDIDPAERLWGIEAGLAWDDAADLVAVYTDRGVSEGMKYGIARHEKAGRKVEYRALNVLKEQGS